MKGHLVFPQREIVELPVFGETIGLEVVPLVIAAVQFVKIDVKDAYLRPGLILLPGMFLLYPCHLKLI